MMFFFLSRFQSEVASDGVVFGNGYWLSISLMCDWYILVALFRVMGNP